MSETPENLIFSSDEAKLFKFFDDNHHLFTALTPEELTVAISLVEKGVLVESKILETPKFRSFKLNK